jgi:hypothetical protein
LVFSRNTLTFAPLLEKGIEFSLNLTKRKDNETHISAFEEEKSEQARLPLAHEHEERSPGVGSPPRQGAPSPDGV